MKHVFYFLTIFPILWEISNLVNVNRIHKFTSDLKAMKGKKYDKYSSSQKAFLALMIGYIIWNFIGFFSFQWPLFLFLFFSGLIPTKYILYRWIDSLISLLILILIILNAYHFKIDILKLLL